MDKTLLERIPFFSHPWLTGPPRISVMGTLEFKFHGERGWQIDPTTFLSIYTGPISVYMRFADSPYASYVGVFRIGQRMPFPYICHPLRAQQYPWDYSQSSQVVGSVGKVPCGREHRSHQFRRMAQHWRVFISDSEETVNEPPLRMYRRHYGKSRQEPE